MGFFFWSADPFYDGKAGRVAIKLLQVPASDCHWNGVDRGLGCPGCEEGRTVGRWVHPMPTAGPVPVPV